ncbi:ferric reduction oxidase 7, chloroplastic-like [Henckelia pumila]|uniref:ferric reduction oxidase 7, chloroplastic-like n=1 Tax=Henckelia pumila TaxID=405737 RepID=UPI003C6E63B4
MEEHSANETLLFKKEGTAAIVDVSKKMPLFISSVKWSLRVFMWVIFITWAAFIFMFPSDFVRDLVQKWILATNGTLFGITGSVFMLFSAPILLLAFLAFAYLCISGDEHRRGKKSTTRYPGFRLKTFPLVVEGPFGVVSAAESIGIVIFITYVIWAICKETSNNLNLLASLDLPSEKWGAWMLKHTGRRLGLIGLFCLTFLFLPVARGSILLRLIDIPFEQATRYHVWLGHLTMFLFSLHGIFYVIGWAIDRHLIHKLLEWKNVGVANLAGAISLLAGLCMWITSLPGVRRLNFELFFYTHQLYVVFVVFLVLHVGDFIFSFAAGAIFLYMLDRFLRFFQSRKTVDVLSARCFPCGTLELVLSKPANLHYNALSWIFLQVRDLSWLQWHPFSVSSSPLDGKNHLAILIKVLGDWTAKLEGRIRMDDEKESEKEPLLQSSSRLTVSVEGPYGHESSHHLTYENLILIAGGIGISPFFAVLSDVLHRINEGTPCLPKNIVIIWAVKTSNELPLLQTVDMESICPNFSDSLNLEILAYVTRESEPSLEEGIKIIEPVSSSTFPAYKHRRGISVLVGTGNIIWSGTYVVASTIGFIVTVAMLDIFYINPYNVSYWWYKGLLFLACMVVSVLIFGGLVICLWHIWERKTGFNEVGDTLENGNSQQTEHKQLNKKSVQEQYPTTIRYGQRPDFRDVFESMSDRWGSVDIGVMVCGPPALQTSVAKECRTQNLKRRGNDAVFHFNSHSFDL